MLRKKDCVALLVLGMACLLLLAGELRAERALTSADFERIQLYQTTKSDVIKWFGPPTSMEKVTGEEILTYQVSKQDPVTKKNVCNLLTVSVDSGGTVTGAVFKKYCAP